MPDKKRGAQPEKLAFSNCTKPLTDWHRQNAKIKTTNAFPALIEDDDAQAFQEALPYILPMLDFLPEAYARPLKMADIDGMKQAEVAAALKLSLSAVKSRIQRARELLKAEFITCCHFETDRNGNLLSFAVKDSCKPLQNLKLKK